MRGSASKNEPDTRERAARALWRKAGNPENTMFEGKPMWQSYLDEVETVIAAVACGQERQERNA